MNRAFALLTGLLASGFSLNLFGQDQVLFTVDDHPVPLEEFVYIYEKTNRDQADYSRASVMEYLDLYQKFKLKVRKAKDMQLDTIKSLQSELAGYRKQLASTYLNDKEVLDGLVEEAYERMQQDVSFSHILFRLNPGAPDEQVEKVYQEALAVQEELRDGADFATTALKFSQDESVKKNQGTIGFMTALMSDGFYELESALYTLPLRTYSRPIRTKIGYHIVRVNERRTARGKIEVRHILARSGANKNPKTKIDNLHQQLLDGADFEQLARDQSEDKKTATRGGYLGAFGINTYESPFETTAFRLKEDGDFSEPVNTSVGWHIIQRVSRSEMPTIGEMRRDLEAQIKKDGRFAIAEQSLVDRIKSENNYRAAEWDQSKLLTELGEDYRTYKWKAPTDYSNQPLFSIGNQSYDVSDFLSFMTTNSAERLRQNRVNDAGEALGTLYEIFEESALMDFEEDQLDDKYPEFKALMREYSEGILLFEATKMRVWDRASEDSVGLNSFYQDRRNNYLWPERAEVESVTINSTDPKILDKVIGQLNRKSGAQLIKKFNKKRELIQSVMAIVEKDNLDPDLQWSKGALSQRVIDEQRDRVIMKRVNKIIPPEPKALDEARGYIIADYQDHLEQAWIDELSQEYKIVVNDQVLNSIIKS